MSSLGFQIVYRLLNDDERIVCERLFLTGKGTVPVSMESARPLDNFPVIFCSISFEHDYLNLVRLLMAGGIEPLSERRPETISGGSPLIILGGVAMFMNPEPLAPFADLIVVGEFEPIASRLIDILCPEEGLTDRSALLSELGRTQQHFYIPRHYRPTYDENRFFAGFHVASGFPAKIKKAVMDRQELAGHSELLTSETEFSDLYLTELGRGCSRGCRFCTAGFIYRPPRLWQCDAILGAIEKRPEGVDRIGLLGMEMTHIDVLEAIAGKLRAQGCRLSFSSLRADRISDGILELLSESRLKSVAIAPDGASERLRRVINKGLAEKDLLSAAERLVEAGLYKLRLYLMVGLPTENDDDLDEFVELVAVIRSMIDPIGRKRGRLSEIIVSINSFVPKPWTPFEYHPFGSSARLENNDFINGKQAVRELNRRIRFLKKKLDVLANTRINVDKPDNLLFQAVLSRGDRRLALVLMEMATTGISWKQAMIQHDLHEGLYATRQYSEKTRLPWRIIDHGINEDYLWNEYNRAFHARLTPPCDTERCRRCGVCHD